MKVCTPSRTWHLPCACILTLGMSAITTASEGGFVGIQASYVSSQDINVNDPALRLNIGPNFTPNLSAEFSLVYWGEMGYDKPVANTSGSSDTTPPTFNNVDPKAGSVSRSTAKGTRGEASFKPSKATYTGLSTFTPYSLFMSLRYRYPLSESFYVYAKAGANLWWAERNNIRIEVQQTGAIKEETLKQDMASGLGFLRGAGIMWQPLESLAIRFEYEATEFENRDISNTEMDIISLALQVEF